MTYSNSLSYPNVLRLLADEIERTEQLQAQVEENAQLVKWVKDFEKTSGEFSIRNTALLINLSPRFLFQYLRDKGILIDKYKANTEYCKQGFLVERSYSFKQKNGNMKTIYSTRITPAGLVYIWTLLWHDGLVPV